MRCWKCANEVPLTPFCRTCGSPLPDPDTRRTAITSRLAEISAERTVLEAQLQRIDGVAVTPTPSAAPVVASVSPAVATILAPPPSSRVSTPSAPRSQTPLLGVDVTPATVVTLLGVVLLAAASLVSAKENPALISLSHSTRLIVLAGELIAACAATWYLASRRNTLADAFGALTWSASLSFGLLASVHVATGTRDDLWTYSLPFLVGGFTVALGRSNLVVTRFLGGGTLGFGLIHLAYFGLNPNVNGYFFAGEVPMIRGAVVMLLISVAASFGMWVSFSPRLPQITLAERYLVGLTVLLLTIVSVAAPLPDVTSTSSGVVALIAELSLAVPLFVAAWAIARRRDNPNAVTAFGAAGGLVVLAFLAGALLGQSSGPVTTFPGSRQFTILFPVIFAAIAVVLTLAATKWATARRTLGFLVAVSLIPSLGAVAASLRFELLGALGRGQNTAVLSAWGTGWFGRGVTIHDVAPLLVGISGAVLTAGVVVVSRVSPAATAQRALRQLAGFVGTATGLAVALRYTPADASPQIVAVTLLVLSAALFGASRCVRHDAVIDEWPPVVLLSLGLVSSLFHNVAATGTVFHYEPGGITIAALALGAVAGVVTALRRRTELHEFVGWAVIVPALAGISAIHPQPRLTWHIAILVIGSLMLGHGLATRSRDGAITPNASSGLVLGGSFAYLTQLAGLVETGLSSGFKSPASPFRIGVTLLALAVTVAAAERRGAQLRAFVAVPALLAGLYWGDHIDSCNYAALWLAGTVLVLLVLLVRQPLDRTASWSTFGPALTLGFAASDEALFNLPHHLAPSAGHFGLLVAAGVTALIGYRFASEAPLQIGAVSMGVAVVANHHFSLPFTVLSVAFASALIVAAVQRRVPTLRLTGRSVGVAGIVGGLMWLETLQITLAESHRDVALVLALVALLLLAATRRMGAVFESRFVLFGGIAAGLVWARNYDVVAAPGLWLVGAALILLALTWQQDEPEHASWYEWGPSLALTMIPANYGALTGSSLSAAFAIGAAVVLVIVGVQLKKRAVFDVAIATFTLLSIARLSQVVSDQGRWVAAVLVGAALVGNGFWRETRKKAGGESVPAVSWYRSLR